MRFIKTLASLLVVLITAGGVPHASALDSAAGARSAQHTLSLTASDTSRLPADAVVSREGVRADSAAAWRDLQIHPGVVPGSGVAPELARSRTIALASGASVTLLSFPSLSLRGPPPVI